MVAANRDEYHARATERARWWDEGWLAGRDLAAGGTWLGVTRAGRWALLTNVRDPSGFDPGAPSRGTLVTQLLAAPGSAGEALGAIVSAGAHHNGFNLLAGNVADAHWGTNRELRTHALAAGIHGISNARLDTPWPKVVHTKAAIAAWCAAGGPCAAEIEPLFAILGARQRCADADLPDTGVTLAQERVLSAPFIVSDAYGTRCSTVLTITNEGDARFVERSFDPAGVPTGEVDFEFRLSPTGSATGDARSRQRQPQNGAP